MLSVSTTVTDDLLALLEHRYRRQVLQELLDSDARSVPLEACLDWATNGPGAYEEVRPHLEMLVEADLIEFDERARRVEEGPQIHRIAPFIRAIGRVSEGQAGQAADAEADQLALINKGLEHDLVNRLMTVQARVAKLTDPSGETDLDHEAVIEDQLAEMERRLRTMGRLTESIADEGGRDLEGVALDETLTTEAESLRERYPDADVTVIDVPSVEVLADERLSLVFENLLRNALEHNDTDLPTVRALGDRVGDRVFVKVADDGPGMPESVASSVFESPEAGIRSDRSGFGLHFVARTVADYDGTIEVEDREPRGTEVQVVLPVADGDA